MLALTVPDLCQRRSHLLPLRSQRLHLSDEGGGIAGPGETVHRTRRIRSPPELPSRDAPRPAEPVDRIRAKITRAKQHIEDFQLALKAFYDTKPYPILVKEDTEAGQRVYYLGEVAEVPMNVETIAADVLANLRSVPDQIAYRLEILGGAKPDDRIYFPIAESAAKYPAMRDRYIKRAGQAAIDAIDATEPYKGGKGNWLWQLNTLHKAWPVLDMSVVIAPADKLLPLKKGDELFREPLDMEVDEQLPFALSVSLNQPGVIDAEPALKSLVELTNATDALLTSFEPLLA